MPKRSSESLPIVLVPGLNCSARLYAEQIPVLWPFGPVTIADHTRGDSMTAIAAGILAAAPARFTLAGLSMGGYIALEIVRQAAGRVARLALLDTASRPEAPEQTAKRIPLMELARSGRFAEVPERQFPVFVHRHRHSDERLKTIVRLMAEETGPEVFLRQQAAIIGREDARAGLAAIACPTLVLVGDGDELTPPFLSQEIAAGISGARLVVIPDCGHLSTLERPEAVNAALSEWIVE